jgi:hypothetical protein
MIDTLKMTFWVIVIAFLLMIAVHPELLVMGDW